MTYSYWVSLTTDDQVLAITEAGPLRDALDPHDTFLDGASES